MNNTNKNTITQESFSDDTFGGLRLYPFSVMRADLAKAIGWDLFMRWQEYAAQIAATQGSYAQSARHARIYVWVRTLKKQQVVGYFRNLDGATMDCYDWAEAYPDGSPEHAEMVELYSAECLAQLEANKAREVKEPGKSEAVEAPPKEPETI